MYHRYKRKWIVHFQKIGIQPLGKKIYLPDGSSNTCRTIDKDSAVNVPNIDIKQSR